MSVVCFDYQLIDIMMMVIALFIIAMIVSNDLSFGYIWSTGGHCSTWTCLDRNQSHQHGGEQVQQSTIENVIHW